MISEKYGVPSASTGAMLREEKRRDSALGQAAHAFTKTGRYFPDEIALAVVEKWLDETATDGFILDGFPRTVTQAEKFDELLAARRQHLDAAINLDLSEAQIRKRIESRLTCPQCAKPFSEEVHRVREGDACPNCGGTLQRRRDDTLETLAERLRQHEQWTAPVVEFYRRTGRLREVDASPGSEAIFAEIVRALEEVSA